MLNDAILNSPALDDVRRLLLDVDPQTVVAPSLRPAAVLLLLEETEVGLRVLLQRRSDVVEHHKGEISFPGGARDPEDADLRATALREAQEEMGIDPDHVTVLGRLDDVTTKSNFVVASYVGHIPSAYPLVVSTIECAEVLHVPLASLLDPRNLREEARWSEGALDRTFAYAFNHHLIYGATARIMAQFLNVVRPAHVQGRGEL